MKQLQKIILAALGVCLFTACDIENGGDTIWDIAPLEFQIFITDNDGHDLLDSTFQNNLLKDITISYEGKTYPVKTEREFLEERYGNSLTRAYMPTFYGLILRQYWLPYHQTYESFLLLFGEFNGEENVDKREITLNLPNQQPIRLSYKNSFKWKSDGSPKKSTQFYLDNQELKDDAGKSGCYHFRYSNTSCEYVPSVTK